jgi:hypothetical protein
MSAVTSPSPPPARSSEPCPMCGAQLHPEQEWCTRCGAAARTRLAATPNWKLPTFAVALVVALSLGVLAAAVIKLVGNSSSPASTAASALPLAGRTAAAAASAPASGTATTTATPTTGAGGVAGGALAPASGSSARTAVPRKAGSGAAGTLRRRRLRNGVLSPTGRAPLTGSRPSKARSRPTPAEAVGKLKIAPAKIVPGTEGVGAGR